MPALPLDLRAIRAARSSIGSPQNSCTSASVGATVSAASEAPRNKAEDGGGLRAAGYAAPRSTGSPRNRSRVNEAAPAGSLAQIRIGTTVYPGLAGTRTDPGFKDRRAAWEKGLAGAVRAAGYPERANPAKINKPLLVALLTVLILYATMVYGPIAAALVELFPTNIRYTSLSLPYHIGNGWLGGLLPTTAFALVVTSGNSYQGLWYPVLIAGGTFIVGLLLVPETRGRDIDA